MRYVILANSNDKRFDRPRQLVEVNGEPLIVRTIRLLKENGVEEEDILISADDERFDGLGAQRYTNNNSTYNYENEDGYWLDAFPMGLLKRPVCFIWGDVYFSENAIKTIVETTTTTTMFFCAFENHSPKYIKPWDEPLAYKVVDTDAFKEGIRIAKKLYDEKATWRNPVVWELYRVIHGQNINVHKMTTDYIAINDESCDIDCPDDLEKLKEVLK